MHATSLQAFENEKMDFFRLTFRPSELVALYRECKIQQADEQDLWKMRLIEQAFMALTGQEITSWLENA